MSLIRSLITSLILIVGSASFAQELKIEDQDLTDLMSPAELMQEIGVSSDLTTWPASAQDPRLVLVIDRAEKGTSLTAQTIEVYVDGERIHSFKTSTGKEKYVTTPSGRRYFATTPVGEFKIYFRNRFHVSKTWSGAQMHFAQFFNGGIAVHATTPSHYAALGSRDSGGCARLHPKNAEILWNIVGEIGAKETKVIVFDGSYQKHPALKSWEQPMVDDGGIPIVIEKPKPRVAPIVIPVMTPKPTPTATPKPTPLPPARPNVHSYPPAAWLTSPNPTPPPAPPPGVRDTYPYCRTGYWCPYN